MIDGQSAQVLCCNINYLIVNFIWFLVKIKLLSYNLFEVLVAVHKQLEYNTVLK